MLPHEREGSGAPKGAGNIDTPCGARPVRWAFTSRRSTAAFFLRPRDRLLKTDRGGLYGTPLIRRAFARFHPLHQPVAGRTHVVGPGRVSRGPRRPGWLGRTLRRRIPPRSHAPHENALGRVER